MRAILKLGFTPDDINYDKDSAARIWANDSVQIAFTNERTSSGGRTEFALGITDARTALGCYATLVKKENINEFSEDTEYVVVRDDVKKVTTYEAKIPWSEIYESADFAKGRKSHYISVLVNDNDGPGVNNQGNGRGWLEYCDGIGVAKNAAAFIEIPVIKRPGR